MIDDDFFLGPYFCKNVNDIVASIYTTSGLEATLEPTTCAAASVGTETGPVATEQNNDLGNGVAALLTPADDPILVRIDDRCPGCSPVLTWTGTCGLHYRDFDKFSILVN